APLYAMKQAGDAIINTKKLNSKTRKGIAKEWRYVGLGLGAFSLLGVTPFITSFIYFPAGIGLIASSFYADYYYGLKGGKSIVKDLINGDESDFEEVDTSLESDVNFSEEDEDKGSDLSGFGSDFSSFDSFGGFGGDESESLSDRYADFVDDDDEEVAFVEDDYDLEEMGNLATEFFPESPIDTSTSEDFRKGLLDVFTEGESSRGNMLTERRDIVKYYAKYMPNNDKGFSRWTRIKEHSPEYDNVAYTIYKALVAINGKFDMKNAVPNKDKLTVMEMKRTPLIYKITVKLPN